MTRCECAGLDFTEIARRSHADELSPGAVISATGVGRNCTACIPDLLAFIAQLEKNPD